MMLETHQHKPKLDLVKILVDAGADTGVRDSFGFSLVEAAEEDGHYDIVAYLQDL